MIAEYDPRWPALYEEEAGRVRAALGDVLLSLEHVGSTAVPHLAAKPIVDLLGWVRALPEAEAAAPRLEPLGYECVGEFGIPGRLYFPKGAPRTHHLHLYEPGHQNASDNLLFRDYLRAHPEEAARYETLKRELAVRFRFQRADYTAAKTDYIQAVLEKARQENTYATKP